MSDELISTKLHIPPRRKDLVVRPRLVEQLNASLDRRLTCLSAPAGFGKTTLLSAWAAQCGRPTAWLTLDKDDSDPSLFLRYLAAALEHLGVKADLPREDRLPASPKLTLSLSKMINQVALQPQESVLILDDYHLVTEDQVHNALVFLVEHLPDNLHLIIASRADPPLPLARLRARGQLAELHLSDLRFSPQEAEAFLNQTMRLGLSPGQVNALFQRTEGWIAGLQMAALSLQDRPDTDNFIRGFTGSNRYVLDYLLEEVLQGQTRQVQQFLLRTSHLDQMCASLCEAVYPDLASGEAQALLDHLERHNLFIQPLDERREWYRYHRLFADLLQRQFSLKAPGELPALHQRACTWYEAHTMLGEAIDHALLARDFAHAGALMERIAESLLMNSQVATLARWADALPDDILEQQPRLHFYITWGLFYTGRPSAELQQRLQQITRSGAARAEVAGLQAYLAIFQGRVEEAALLAQQCLDLVPAESPFLRSLATWISGICRAISGESIAMDEWVEQLVKADQESGNLLMAIVALSNLAESHLSRGSLGLAEECCQRGLSLALDAHGQLTPIATQALATLGGILYERNELAEAQKALEKAIGCASHPDQIDLLDAHLHLTQVYQHTGHPEQAALALERAASIAARFDSTEIDDRLVSLFKLSLRLQQGDLEYARQWLAEHNQTASADETRQTLQHTLQQHEQIIKGRALLALGDYRDAAQSVQPLLAIFGSEGRRRRLCECLALSAAAHFALGEYRAAEEQFDQALALADECGFTRVILDLGAAVKPLLKDAIRRGIHSETARRLLQALSPAQEYETQPAAQPASAGGLPLSPRELEVLRLIAAGLSNQAIADRLFLSLRTVKFHTTNIFGKLGVQNRTQAAACARESGLL